MQKWDGQTTLADVQAFLTAHWEKGAHCPACMQFVKLYHRPINYHMAWLMVQLHLHNLSHPGEFCYLPKLVLGRHLGGGDYAKLFGFGLIEPDNGMRADGSARTGFWRITYLGTGWVTKQVRLDRYVLMYNDRYYGTTQFTEAGKLRPQVGILDALGTHFDYDKLMAGEA